MIDFEKAHRLLGMANRARMLTLGMSATVQSLRKGQTQLLIVAEDLSDNAKSKLKTASGERHIETVSCGNKDELGRLFGRSELGIVGVDDPGFAKTLFGLLVP